MASLRQPTEQELRDLALTLAGEIAPSRSPYNDPQTRVEAANILASVVNRFSTDNPQRFGGYRVRSFQNYSDVVREPSQYSTWRSDSQTTMRQNYDARPDYFNDIVRDFFSGDLQPTFPNATHYHADYADPRWGRNLASVGGTLGNTGPHIFYNDEAWTQAPLGERRPSYAMAAPTLTRQREDQPNPQDDLNAQELANVAPSLPATLSQMEAARNKPQWADVPQPTARPDWAGGLPTVASATPDVQARTLGGYRENIFSPTHSEAGFDSISPRTRDMLDRISQSVDMSRLGVNSGYRTTERNAAVGGARNSPHLGGHAVDIDISQLNPSQRGQLLDAAVDAGARGIGVANSFLHIDTDPNKQGRRGDGFRTWGYGPSETPAPWAAQTSERYRDLAAGEAPASLPYLGVVNPSSQATSRQGDGSLDAVPGITPRQDPRDITLPVAMPQPSRESMVQNYGQRALQTSPASLPQMAGGSSSNTTARINQGFNDALAPRSMPSAIARVSPQGSFGTSSPQRSPDQFQYATRPTPSPSSRMETRTREVANPAYAAWESTQRASNQRSPTDFQYAPQGPSMSTMAANYGARALQGSDPFASAPPRTITERYQVSVPNPVARPNMAAPTPRGPQFAGVPNPMARPSSLPQRRGGLEQAFAGFNDWIGERLPTMGGAAIGGALGGPLGALVGGLGGYGMQQVMGNQGGNNGQPMNINPAPAPVQNINNPAWSNPIFGVSQTVGQGDSAFDSFYDSQYGGGGFAW